MMDFFKWLLSEPPLLMMVLGLLGICIQVARMAIREETRPDTPLSEADAERLAQAAEREAREVEKFVNTTLTADIREEFLRLFWSYHDKVVLNLRRARIRDTLNFLMKVNEIENHIADGLEKGILRYPADGMDVSAAVTGISRNYCDRIMRVLGPHLRHQALQRVGEVTGRQVDPRSGRAVQPRPNQEPARPSARDAFRRR